MNTYQSSKTPITTPWANVAQRKNGYQFTINDRSSYFDWLNAYFEEDFRVVQEAKGISGCCSYCYDAASIADLQVKQNGNNRLR